MNNKSNLLFIDVVNVRIFPLVPLTKIDGNSQQSLPNYKITDIGNIF